MAMGRAIITTNNIGCRETVIDGVNGIFVNEQDSRDLENKLMWMIKHSHMVSGMGKQSYEICRRKFDVQIINEIILEAMGV